MKRLLFFDKTRYSRSVLLALVFLASLSKSEAAAPNPYTWANQNSSMTVDYLSGAGLTSWMVDGQNQVDNQWFYYRAGSGPGAVASIETIGPATTATPTGKFQVTYTAAAFNVRTLFSLTGNLSGSGQSGGSETVTIFNTSGAPLTFDFFQLSHFSLADSSGNETVSIQTGTGGNPHNVLQFNSSGASLNEIVTPEADHAEAATGASTINSMLLPTFTHLNGNASASGDVTFGLEWDFSIPTGGSAQISIPMAIVPEPSSLAILCLGIVAVALRRRQNCA